MPLFWPAASQVISPLSEVPDTSPEGKANFAPPPSSCQPDPQLILTVPTPPFGGMNLPAENNATQLPRTDRVEDANPSWGKATPKAR